MTDQVEQVAETPAALEAETPAIADQTAEPAPAEVKEQPKEVDKVQRRIDKLTREKYQLRGELDAYRSKLAEIEQRLNGGNQTRETRPTPSDQPPRLEQFSSLEEWQDARDAWRDAQNERRQAERAQKAEQERNQTQEQARQRELAEGWEKRVAAVRSTLEDFDEVIEASEAPLTRAVAEAIMESDMGPQVAYFLARNPAEAEKLAGMSPSSVARAIGRIEAKLEGESLAKQKSSAPKPADPVGSRAKASNDPEKMSDSEWAKAERERRMKRKA